MLESRGDIGIDWLEMAWAAAIDIAQCSVVFRLTAPQRQWLDPVLQTLRANCKGYLLAMVGVGVVGMGVMGSVHSRGMV